MFAQDLKNETVKARVTGREFRAIRDVAARRNTTVAELLRSALADMIQRAA